MIRRKLFAVLLFLLSVNAVFTQENENLIKADNNAALVPNLRYIKGLMRKSDEFSEIAPAPILGLFQIAVGTQIYYLSADGRYLLRGELLDLKEGVNISETHKKSLRKVVLQDIPLKDLIVFKPAIETLHSVVIFSNLNCSYCRSVYEDIPKFLQLGVEVRLAPFIHAPRNSQAHKKITEVWCSPDRKTALERNYREQKTVPAFCDDSFLEDDYIIALKLGISAIPTYVLEDGELLNGYIAPEALIKILRHKDEKN